MPDQKLLETKARLDGISPTACGAKWYQTTLHLFNGNTQSCHHVLSHRVPLKEILKHPSHLHNSPAKIAARKKMMNGRQIRECRYCWDLEKSGALSDRHIKSSEPWAFSRMESSRLQRDLKKAIPTYLEVAFDNICNLKCLYCSPVYSSSWQAEINKFGPYPTSRRFNNLTQFRLQKTNPLKKEAAQIYKEAFWKWWPELRRNLKHLRVTGGEPLLSADVWKLLEELQRESFTELILSINSNLMISAGVMQKFTTALEKVQPKVQKVILFCSIDTVGGKAEYLRHGLNENLFYQNLEHILNCAQKPIHLSFMITLNVLSVSGLGPLLFRIMELQEKYPKHMVDFDLPYLRHPRHLSLLLLPETFECYLEEALQVLKRREASPLQQEKIKRVLTYWRANRFKGIKKFRLQRDLKRFLFEHDRRRHTNFRKTFPEYEDFISQIKDPRWLPLF